MTTESQGNNKRVFRVAQGDSQTPESEPEINFELAVRLTAFDDADDILTLHKKAVVAAQKALLERLKARINDAYQDIIFDDELAALERQQLGKEHKQ